MLGTALQPAFVSTAHVHHPHREFIERQLESVDENSTSYDYSVFYDDPIDYSPSNFSDVKNFSQVFLPTLYSLVFILGFIGNALTIILTVFDWILSLFFSLPDFIFTEVTEDSSGFECDYPQNSTVWERYDLFNTNVLGLVIPLLVMVGCYSRIIPTLVTMRTTKKHRMVKLIICIVVVFFLLWAPYNISRFLKFLQEKTIIQHDLTLDKNLRLSVAVTEAIAYTHCCLNPIIYAFGGQKFMRRALQLLKRLVPGYIRNLSNSSFRRSSVISKSSEVTSTYVM